MKHRIQRFSVGLLTPVLCLTFVLVLRSQITSPKVDSFLRSLPTFANADSGRAAFNMAKFTESERRLLENAFRDPRYALQVERLVKTIKGPAPGPRPAVKGVLVLQQEQATKILTVNTQLSAEAKRLVALSAQATASAAMRAVTGNPPKITSLSQLTIEPGQSLIIRGRDLLPRGSVTFTFGSSSFEAQVSEWTNDLIFAQLPAGIRGVAEMDGNVTVRKQNRMLRADAPIHFVPTWEYQVLRSNALTYASEPWNLAAALALFVFTGQTSWCAQFYIHFPSLPSHNLLNTWTINNLKYDSEHRVDIQSENTLGYIGSTKLPSRTGGSLCHPINAIAEIYCVVTIKGPLGVPYK